MASVASTSSGMSAAGTAGHRLAAGVQVRQEQNGLLFYNRSGPRLYFLSCGDVLSPGYFGSRCGLTHWLLKNDVTDQSVCQSLSSALTDLVTKEVLLAD